MGINYDTFKKWLHTPRGRANKLLATYRREDEKHNRGECTLTAEWIVEHIFSKPCAHCGKTGWKIIGCNRLNNSLPHTPDNIEPCCYDCNVKLSIKEKKKLVYQYTLEGELVKIWESARECGRNGFNQGSVSAVCRGGYFRKGKWTNCHTYKGYIWSYVPL